LILGTFAADAKQRTSASAAPGTARYRR
jgi:hypothetical protein